MKTTLVESNSIPVQPVQRRKNGLITRMFIGLLAGVLILLVIGVIFQTVGTAVDLRKYTPPGQMIDVGGFKMHISCAGEGSPTVILDHVGASNSEQWALIQPEVAKVTRTCSYDRAGYGWSESSREPQDVEHAAQHLHTLLANAGIDGPVVLVGHSYGANVGRVFAADFPDITAGLVQVDPGKIFNRPEVEEDLEEEWQADGKRFMEFAPFLSRIGLLRLAALLGVMPGHVDLPDHHGQAFDALQLTNKFYDTLKAVNKEMFNTSVQVMAAEESLVDLPILVISAGNPKGDRSRQAWTNVNATIAARSAYGVHHVIEGAGHMDLAVNKDFAWATTNTILEMVAVIRGEQLFPAN